MHGFDSSAGCIPSAAELRIPVCRGTGNLSGSLSTSHRFRPKRLHVLGIHISSVTSHRKEPIDFFFVALSVTVQDQVARRKERTSG